MEMSGEIERLKKISLDIDWNKKLSTLSLLLYPVGIGFYLRPKYLERLQNLYQYQNEIFSQISTKISTIHDENLRTSDNLAVSNTFLVYPKKFKILSLLQKNLDFFRELYNNRIILPPIITEQIIPTKTVIQDVNEKVVKYNENFVQGRMEEYQWLFEKSPFPLDENQKKAVIVDDCHNLIVAGAGSGKTEVIINRIAYLLERKPDTINPEKILVLAYQNKAANEIHERLVQRYQINVKIKTFHALGKEICERASQQLQKEIPRLKFSGDNADIQFSEHMKLIFRESKEDPIFQQLLWKFIKAYGDLTVVKTESDFEDPREYYEYVKNLRYTTLTGIKVKSQAERDIFNFYFTHRINNKNIKVEYEYPAEWMKYTNSNGIEIIPHPDFYLPDLDIYHEHWAIDKNGNVPPWFSGENPQHDYIEGMEKKKKKFQEANCLLIETSSADYSNENFESFLSSKFQNMLKKKYPNSDISLEQIPYHEIIGRVWEECRQRTKKLDGHVANFISIAKTYALDPDAIEKRLHNESWSGRQLAFAWIALFIYKKYEESLRSENAIDFSDMINLAINALENSPNLYAHEIDHILIDEYQDISQQRFLLINALKQKNPDCHLFCVGDDWQSIMGFAGANMDLFVNFQDYFGHPYRTDLSVNYRSTKSIVETGQAIIRHNQNQIQKDTTALRQEEKLVKIIRFHSHNEKAYGTAMAHYCVDLVANFLNEGYNPDDIFILSRIVKGYNIQQTLLQYAKERNVPITNESRLLNHVHIMSIHKSKGLQARIVIILNVDSSLYGLPCELENPDIYQPAIIGRVRDHKEEERRLFYVAITRAKDQAILFTWNDTESSFIKEISPHLEYLDVS